MPRFVSYALAAAGFLFGGCSSYASAQAQNVSCKVVAAGAAASPAEEAWREGDRKRALELFKADLAKAPGDGRAIEGVVRVSLSERDAETARKLVEANKDSKDEWVLLASSEYFNYRGQEGRAQQAAAMAVAANLCNAQAHLQSATLYETASMYGKAKKQIDTAHALDKSDPRITYRWLRLQPDSARETYYKALSANPSLSKEEREAADNRLEHLADAAASKHSCRMTSAVASTNVRMVPHMSDGQNIAAWALDVDINGHQSRLQIDTGASGILIDRIAADKAGLKPFSKMQYFGIGGKGIRNGFVAYADHIKVGEFTFEDCLVDVADGKVVSELQGLIGTDVFKNFMVTLDFPERTVKLAPLPGPAGTRKELSDDDDDEQPPAVADRYDGPELKDFLPIYRTGHDLLLPMLLNKTPELLILDTGADSTMFNSDIAKEFTKITSDKSFTLEGVSGKTNNVFTTGSVTMQFGAIGQLQNGAVAAPLTGMSGGIQTAGVLGASFLYNLVIDIDYRDGMVRLTYDRNHGANAWRNL